MLKSILNMGDEKPSKLIPWSELTKNGWSDAIVGEGIPVGPNDIIAYAPRTGSGKYFFLRVRSISNKEIVVANQVIRPIKKGKEYKYRK